MLSKRLQEILNIIIANKAIKISDIQKKISEKISIPTLNRALAKLKKQNYIIANGSGAGVNYTANYFFLQTAPIDIENYFAIDADERTVQEKFNFEVFDSLNKISLFDKIELTELKNVQKIFAGKSKKLSKVNFKKEFERLMIELSWKSSQIEGNTYDLIDTEQLLKYNIKNKKYSQEDTQMLLNHKLAIEFTYDNRDIYKELSVNKIIEIHTLVTQKMGISKNIRKRLVRITGTKYTPLDNEYQIHEALEEMCTLINNTKNIFEKSFLAVLLLSYIQPFEDGNKRTARLTANGILMANNYSPLSYRSVSPADYKKAILLFYEIQNISAFKKIFIDQYQFAVENYF